MLFHSKERAIVYFAVNVFPFGEVLSLLHEESFCFCFMIFFFPNCNIDIGCTFFVLGFSHGISSFWLCRITWKQQELLQLTRK